MKKMFMILFAILCATGCAIGPDYMRPAIDIPQSFRYEIKEAVDTANTAWWKQFNDPVLDGLIVEALANNNNVKIAAHNVEQAAAMLMTTRSALFPQANYTGAATRRQASRNDVTPPPAHNPYTSLQALGGATWEIDLWGRVRRLTEAAQAKVFATEEARRGAILSLVAEVASGYIQLRAQDEQLAIAREALKTYGESVRIFELQRKYGQISQMIVEQVRSQYETAAAAIPRIESDIVRTENALSVLLGRNPGPVPRGRGLAELTMPPVPTGLPSQLLERRPDILQAEQNLIAANAQIGAARALYFPEISLTGSFGASSADLADLFKGPSNTWNFGGSITGPIFKAGGITGQVRQAEAGQKAALLSYEETIRRAFADMENVLSSHQKLGEEYAAESRRVSAYKEYARLARLQYDGGYEPYLTVLYAETQLFPAELNAVQVRSASFIALTNIYKALGGGWITEADMLTKPERRPPFKNQLAADEH